jgi:hypothetical protein
MLQLPLSDHLPQLIFLNFARRVPRQRPDKFHQPRPLVTGEFPFAELDDPFGRDLFTMFNFPQFKSSPSLASHQLKIGFNLLGQKTEPGL